MTRADASGGLTFERVLILAPRGRDAQLASVLLREIECPTFICADIRSLCMELSEGAACALVAEEAMIRGNMDQLAAWVRTQPAWSDFPIVLLTGRDDSPERPIFATQVQDLLGNISFLERPFHPTTLINITRSAVRSRHRQYEARDLLGRYELLARELQHPHKKSYVDYSIHRVGQSPGGRVSRCFFCPPARFGKSARSIVRGRREGRINQRHRIASAGEFCLSSDNRGAGRVPKCHHRSGICSDLE
jgi:hypothetical protein